MFHDREEPVDADDDVDPDGRQRGAGDVGDGHGDGHGGGGAADADGDGDVLPVPADDGDATGCSVGRDADRDAVTLNGSGVATLGADEATSRTLAIGKYCWRAVYSGDSVYFGSTHTGNVASECFTTVKVNPTVATLSSTTASTVVPGTSVTDTVTVSGGPGQPTPTGTVTWFLCQPNEVTAGQGCVAGGTQVGR